MVFKIFILALVLDGVIVQSELDLMKEVLRALRIGENESDVVHEALIQDAECANARSSSAPILPSCRALTVSLRVLHRVLVCTCAYEIQDGVALDLYLQVNTLLDHLHKVHTHLTAERYVRARVGHSVASSAAAAAPPPPPPAPAPAADTTVSLCPRPDRLARRAQRGRAEAGVRTGAAQAGRDTA